MTEKANKLFIEIADDIHVKFIEVKFFTIYTMEIDQITGLKICIHSLDDIIWDWTKN